jgi:hypothetical protein
MNLNIHINTATIHVNREAGEPGAFSEMVFGTLATAGEASASVRGSAPEMGQPWPDQGGILAGSMPAEDGQPGYYLIVPADGAETEDLKWGPTNKEIEGLSARDGKANTAALTASKLKHPAAEFCAGLKLHGFDDYYLPSRREASLMAATVPHLFTAGYHWTSSQASADTAFVQDFSDGTQYSLSKGNEWRVRAVRRVNH